MKRRSLADLRKEQLSKRKSSQVEKRDFSLSGEAFRKHLTSNIDPFKCEPFTDTTNTLNTDANNVSAANLSVETGSKNTGLVGNGFVRSLSSNNVTAKLKLSVFNPFSSKCKQDGSLGGKVSTAFNPFQKAATVSATFSHENNENELNNESPKGKSPSLSPALSPLQPSNNDAKSRQSSPEFKSSKEKSVLAHNQIDSNIKLVFTSSLPFDWCVPCSSQIECDALDAFVQSAQSSQTCKTTLFQSCLYSWVWDQSPQQTSSASVISVHKRHQITQNFRSFSQTDVRFPASSVSMNTVSNSTSGNGEWRSAFKSAYLLFKTQKDSFMYITPTFQVLFCTETMGSVETVGSKVQTSQKFAKILQSSGGLRAQLKQLDVPFTIIDEVSESGNGHCKLRKRGKTGKTGDYESSSDDADDFVFNDESQPNDRPDRMTLDKAKLTIKVPPNGLHALYDFLLNSTNHIPTSISSPFPFVHASLRQSNMTSTKALGDSGQCVFKLVIYGWMLYSSRELLLNMIGTNNPGFKMFAS